MASSRKSRPVASFRHPIPVEVFEPQFTMSSSLRFLDVDALSRTASADVVIGEVDGGCCSHQVYAKVRRGMVVAIGTRPCPESRATLPREHATLVAAAMKRVTARRRATGRKLPMPAAAFFGNTSVARAVTVDVLVCIRICILGICFTCCRVTTTPNAPVFCGRVTIDTTKTG